MNKRSELSIKYAKGYGLEIAPFHNSWPLHPGIVHVEYMDLFTSYELRKQYPEHANDEITDTTIIGDGQTCEVIPDCSLDFVFSSHVLEHCPNTIRTILNWLRVVEKGGYVIMAIPLKDNPIDKNRIPTTWEHLLLEFEENCSHYYYHYLEYHTVVDGLKGYELTKRVCDSMTIKPHIHFHCWDMEGIGILFSKLMEMAFPIFSISEIHRDGWEVFVVLKKDV